MSSGPTRLSRLPRPRRLPGQPQTSWSNWAGNQTCSPAQIERPLTEAQVQQVVRQAINSGRRVRPVGSGHSFTAIACTDDVLVSLEHLNLVRSIDRENGLVTTQAGIDLDHLNRRLANAGLAMTNLGDIAYQSLAGAVSTGTHGTGLDYGGIATQIRSMRIVTGSGEIVTASRDEHPELFHSARVGLGAFGIITEITLAVEPAFRLHALEGPMPLDTVLESWDHEVAAHDHYEFFWIPGGELAMVKRNRRTSGPAQPQSKLKYFADKIVGENLAFGAMVKLAQRRPALIPKLRDTIESQTETAEYTDESHRVFASRRWVRFVEMEYSVPLDSVPSILREIDQAVAAADLGIFFPIEVRATGPDDIPLSTAYGRNSGYIAVHRSKGQDYRPYFEIVEAIMDQVQGRPHWGKMHFQTAETLRTRYPEWDRFQHSRGEHDPSGVFSNDYTDRVLGPVQQAAG